MLFKKRINKFNKNQPEKQKPFYQEEEVDKFLKDFHKEIKEIK